MKNILIISDAFLNGGLESRIAEQVKYYNKNSINCHFICDVTSPDHAICSFENFSSGYKLTPKNGRLLAQDILESTNNISAYCKKNNIDFIECHPFWCIMPAALASTKCNIPISYTLHGTASGNFIDPIYIEAYIIYYLFLCYGVDILFSVAERLSRIYSYAASNISVIPNSIQINQIPKDKHFKKTGNFAIASRLDKLKTPPILDFLPKLYSLPQTKKIDIYGDGEETEVLSSFIKDKGLSDKITICGWKPNLINVFINNNYDCVFGVGRIITDAITSYTPAGILGYNGFAGLINKDNITDFANLNFISWDHTEPTLINQEINKLYREPKKFHLDLSSLSFLDAKKIWNKQLTEEQNTKHKTDPIIKKLHALLKDHKEANLLIDQSMIANLYEILFSLNPQQLIPNSILQKYHPLIVKPREESLQKDIQILFEENLRIKNSSSWKITKPLRRINKIIQYKNHHKNA